MGLCTSFFFNVGVKHLFMATQAVWSVIQRGVHGTITKKQEKAFAYIYICVQFSVFIGFLSRSVSCAFSWALFLLFACLVQLQCVVFLFYLIIFYLLYCIVFYYYPLEACLVSSERPKGRGSRWEGRWRGAGRSRGRGDSNQDTEGEGGGAIFNKRKQNRKERGVRISYQKEAV